MGIETVYIFCFVVGAVYALIAGVGAGCLEDTLTMEGSSATM